MANISLMKRGSSWQYRFDVTSAEGNRKQISKSGFKTKSEAKEAGITALMSYKQSGITPSSNKVLFSKFVDEWFADYCAEHPRYSTQINRGRIILSHIKPNLGHLLVQDITPGVVKSFLVKLLNSNISPRYSREIMIVLSLILDTAVDIKGYLLNNPCKKIKFPAYLIKSTSEDRFLISKADFKKILDRFDEHCPARAPLLLGYFAGLRIGEAFALTWDDVDFKNKVITINKSALPKAKKSVTRAYIAQHKINKSSFGWYLGPTKTPTSNRVIKVNDFLLNELKKVKKVQEANKEGFGSFYHTIYKKLEENSTYIRLIEVDCDLPILLHEANLVCVDAQGKYFSYENFRKYARIIREELEIPFNYHCLRHTHATLLIESGANIKDVQERLGHSNAMITLTTYTHNTEESRQKSIDILEEYSKEIRKI